jgi:tetratricopeptide (TPR) repeat protein
LALDDVRRGMSRAVLVRGEPGVGKSRLVDAALEDARARGMRIVGAGGDPVDQSTPYAMWKPIFASLLGPGVLTNTSQDLDAVLGSLPDEIRAEARERAGLLGAILATAPPESDATRWMSPEARHENTLRLLEQLLDAQRGAGPLVISIDDAQWIDTSSWALLERVVGGSEATLVVMTARSGDVGQGSALTPLLTDPRVTVIELAGLAADDSLSIVRSALGVEILPDEVGRFVLDRAAGHPFYTVELAYALRDAGLIEIDGPVARLAGDADLERLEFPESIEGVIAVRLDRLPPETRTTLKVASVIGDPFSAPLIGELLGSGSIKDLDEQLESLRGLDMIAAGPPGPDRDYRFRHLMIRDVVYGRLLFAQRRQLHRRAAEHFERAASPAIAGPDALLAHHWEGAGVPARAIDHLEVAGTAALRDGAFVESSAFLGRAIALAEPAEASAAAARGEPGSEAVDIPPARRAGWRWLAAQARYRLGDLDQSRVLAEASLTVIDRPVPRDGAPVVRAIAVEAATQILHRAVSRRFVGRAQETDHERLQRAVRAYLNLAEVYYLASQTSRSAYAAARALNVAETLGPSLELVETYGAICIICGLVGRHGLAERYGGLGRATAEAVDQPYATAIILHQLCLYHSGTGPADQLFADYETAVGLFRSLGDKGRFRDCIGLAGIAGHLFGRLDLAERYLAELLEGHAEGERSLPRTWALTWLAAIDLRRGRAEAALDRLRRAVATQRAERLDMTSISLHGLLALALLRTNRRGEALDEAEHTRRLIAATGGRPSGHPVLDGYTAVADVALTFWDASTSAAEQARWRAAVEESCRSLGSYRKIFPIGEPAFRRYVGELAARTGDARRADRERRRSLAAAIDLDMRYDVALAHLSLGADTAAEASAGGERMSHLDAAKAVLADMGITADVSKEPATVGATGTGIGGLGQ